MRIDMGDILEFLRGVTKKSFTSDSIDKQEVYNSDSQSFSVCGSRPICNNFLGLVQCV